MPSLAAWHGCCNATASVAALLLQIAAWCLVSWFLQLLLSVLNVAIASFHHHLPLPLPSQFLAHCHPSPSIHHHQYLLPSPLPSIAITIAIAVNSLLSPLPSLLTVAITVAVNSCYHCCCQQLLSLLLSTVAITVTVDSCYHHCHCYWHLLLPLTITITIAIDCCPPSSYPPPLHCSIPFMIACCTCYCHSSLLCCCCICCCAAPCCSSSKLDKYDKNLYDITYKFHAYVLPQLGVKLSWGISCLILFMPTYRYLSVSQM